MALKRYLIQQASSYLCTSSSASRPAIFLARPFSLPNPFPCSSTSSRYSYQTRGVTSQSLLPSPQAPSRRTYTTDTPSPPPGVKIGGERIASEGDHVSIDPHTKRRLPKNDVRRPGPGKESKDREDDVGLDVGDDGVVRGKLSSTTTHLLRLTLPLPSASRPVAFILHPSQPLSYLARLVAAELPSHQQQRVSDVEFRGFGRSKGVRWSDSSDIGDFVKQAAQVKCFTIGFREREGEEQEGGGRGEGEFLKEIDVLVPSFPERTVYLRERLRKVNVSLRELGTVKEECDRLARRGAKRVALGGLGGLVGYWGVVAGLTFYGPGWDLMEPVTYLIGHSSLIAAYCYWLYHQREPSYHAVLDRSISARQSALYSEKGFDLRRYQSLTTEGVRIRDEIYAIAEEYGVDWFEPAEDPDTPGGGDSSKLAGTKIHKEMKENERLVKRARKDEDGDEELEDDKDEDQELEGRHRKMGKDGKEGGKER